MRTLITTLLGLLGLLALVPAAAQRYIASWHDEGTDTLRITRLLAGVPSGRDITPGDRAEWFGRQLLGTPYVAHTLEDSTETLRVNLGQLDCTTLVETVMALAITAGEQRQGWQDYVYNLREIRYRGGTVDGYPSRLHYICDWILDNAHRGHLRDITPDLPHARYAVRTIDYMSRHAGSYPQLADTATLDRIRAVEEGYRNHRFPYIPASRLGDRQLAAALRPGDILAFVSTRGDLDVTHMGMVTMEDGRPHVLHASSTHGRVEISTEPLADFVRRNRSWAGVRVLRLRR